MIEPDTCEFCEDDATVGESSGENSYSSCDYHWQLIRRGKLEPDYIGLVIGNRDNRSE